MRPAGPGPLNLITDVPGLGVGQAMDAAARTGVTVVLPDERVVCAADVRGGGPGTRETDVLAAQTLVEAVDAVVLSGGSVYGLAAADGVAAWLGARSRGFTLVDRPGVPRSPIVPAAILYDLANGGDKAWGLFPPYPALGMAAAESAGPDFALGTAGAGAGAMAGSLKGGLGSASFITRDGYAVGALVAVNSFGSVVAPGGRAFWAAPFEIAGEFGAVPSQTLPAAPDDWGLSKGEGRICANTTIACVATDAALNPGQAQEDGDDGPGRPGAGHSSGCTRRSTGTSCSPFPPRGGPWPRRSIQPLAARLGAVAADCLARAVARAVHEATPWTGTLTPCWRDLPA